jgi:hypothetical protein
VVPNSAVGPIEQTNLLPSPSFQQVGKIPKLANIIIFLIGHTYFCQLVDVQQ